MIYLGSDHRGFKKKEFIRKFLYINNFDFEDLGALAYKQEDNYTKYAEQVASLVSKNKNSKGILFCGSGSGVCIVANKFDGVRATLGLSKKQVLKSREDDDINILCIASDFLSNREIKNMIKAFLKTDFDNKTRHKKRILEIKKLEENN